ncbi:ubiquinone biosynthesis accessory factor UbiJ [Cellvibrio japonicus]|uniref:Ubiquinone biosynthesis accessory factor UbiJ n=1 Tax=Cellvibrio japonicus (strain Ueda107) TaxID=498211 RepID=B3PH49_CELJU|nr:SCP2 sterol-binding domain-containing protein [Cellvibrio japonicus]ACE85155.1 conserved hypothetical protein [Cellvibrio japonicus Ueda107]QEI13849.1 hypothetical protein FY117_17590 [Cellvibrio japonicus]QEI17423.1 hypothetical protein FY116_17595 [Cellvibrio japonicus]QEI20999.1 hypothetical protein FY115_17590 [Cellvibrio japonicus]
MANLLTTAALASAERLVNGALHYDPATRLGLQRLAGQVLAVEITLPAITLYLLPDSEGLRLMGHWEGEVDTRLQGSLPALVQIASADTHSLKDSGVEVMGRTSLLADWQALVRNLDIDWEELLTQLLGDIVGHQAAQVIRSQLHWVGERASSGRRMASEFLTEELKTLPGKAELKDFYQQVDDLRLAVDRAAARVEQLLKEKQRP